jgi:6-phosphofructokinase 1
MNAAVRAAVRLALDRGYTPLAVRDGFEGLMTDHVTVFDWGSVDGWCTQGGANLGVSRKLPAEADLPRLAGGFKRHQVGAVLMIGGWVGYAAVHRITQARKQHPAPAVPIICLPASINNNLPRSEFSLGADTALNSIVDALDKIKASAVAVQRYFVVEVKGHDCGYLALMAAIAGSAEQVYLPEHGVKSADLEASISGLRTQFAHGQRVGLVIRSERANPPTRSTPHPSSVPCSRKRAAAPSMCVRPCSGMFNRVGTRHPTTGSRPCAWLRAVSTTCTRN